MASLKTQINFTINDATSSCPTISLNCKRSAVFIYIHILSVEEGVEFVCPSSFGNRAATCE